MFKQRHFKLAAVVLNILFIAACGNKGKNPEKTELELKPSSVEVSIAGMTCTGCEQTIQAGITRIEGIKSVKADHVAGKAVVEFFPEVTDTLKIKEAIITAGYTVRKFTAIQSKETGE